MGGTAVMVAAAYLGDLVTGVIDLSGPAQFAGMDALAAARRVHVPALFGYVQIGRLWELASPGRHHVR
jgi:hypothetical protein